MTLHTHLLHEQGSISMGAYSTKIVPLMEMQYENDQDQDLEQAVEQEHNEVYKTSC